jgi:aminoglycoside phosphotransferase
MFIYEDRLFPLRFSLLLPSSLSLSRISFIINAASPVRVRVYRALAYAGNHIYGPSNRLKVQRLPFGLYLKDISLEWQQSLANEYGAIPFPRPLDLVSDLNSSFMLTPSVQGYPLGTCIDTLSDHEITALVHELQKFLADLRTIQRNPAAEWTITNAIDKACSDNRSNAALEHDEARGDVVGPFTNEDEFNCILRCGALPDVVHRGGHKIVFTHGDLNMRNVLINNGKLSGIVDWENSGWYPEYRDYTKAHYITKLNRRWLGVVDRVFAAYRNFTDDLETERKLWEYCF